MAVFSTVFLISILFACSESSDAPPESFDESSEISVEKKLSKIAIPTPAEIATDTLTEIPATMHRATFGKVPALSTVEISPALVDSATTTDAAANFSEVTEFLEIELSDLQKKFLDKNKFLLIPIGETKFAHFKNYDSFDEMLAVFDAIGGKFRAPQNAKLITPDVVLHAFHKFFENSLEYLEQNELAETLRHFTANTRQQLVSRKNSADEELAKRYENLAAQFTVAQILLENANWSGGESGAIDTLGNAEKMLAKLELDFSPAVFQKIKNELELIYAAESVSASPLFNQYKKDKLADYTQYTPRSHYSKNSKLRAYFRTMMYFGRLPRQFFATYSCLVLWM